MGEKIWIFDTTLRDGEQSPGFSMNVEEKLRMAAQLAKLGVDVIEAGFPISSEGDFEAVKAVSELYAPVTGEVVEVNSALKDKPESVNSSPHASWMIVVRLADPAEVSGLLDAAQYSQLVSQS